MFVYQKSLLVGGKIPAIRLLNMPHRLFYIKKIVIWVIYSILIFPLVSCVWNTPNIDEVEKTQNIEKLNISQVKQKIENRQSLAFIDLSNLDLSNMNLRNMNLENSNLKGTNLQGTDLEGANLKNVNLNKGI